jgi:PGF-CTERM protein
MQRRELLRGIAGAVGLGSVVLGSGGTVEAHPGPYRPLGSVAVENAREAVPDADGDVAYVAAADGVVAVDVSVPSDPQIIAEDRGLLTDRETGPLPEVQDVKIEGDRLVAAGPANPKQGDVLMGFVLYDVGDPANPEQVAFYETDFPIHNCDLRDGFVYLTGNDGVENPLVVVDVRDDEPTEVGRWSLIDRDETWLEVASGLRSLHDVWVRDDRAYLAHWDAGTVILDVSDPTAPSFVSRVGGRSIEDLRAVAEDDVRSEVVTLPGNDHYAMTDDDGDLLGRNKEAWAKDGEGGPGGVELWDVSDPETPTRLSTIEPPATRDASIGGTWTTSHNFDIVNGRLFTSWYEGGVKIHDISDPSNPEELAWWRDPEATSFWTAKLATGEFFVASSMGRNSNGKGGLYTFPNHPGQQKDAPSLTATAETATKGTTTTDETTTEQTTTTPPTTTEATGAADSSVPGFGVPAGIAALLGAGAWRTLRD